MRRFIGIAIATSPFWGFLLALFIHLWRTSHSDFFIAITGIAVAVGVMKLGIWIANS